MRKFIKLLMILFCVVNVAFAQEATLTLGRPLIDIEGVDALMYNPWNYEVVVFADVSACPQSVEFPTPKAFAGHRIPASQLAENIKSDSLGYSYPLKKGHLYAVGGYTRLRPDAYVLTTECSTFTADPSTSPYFAPTFDQVPDATLMTKVIDIVSMPRSGGYYIGFSKSTSCQVLITDASRVFRLGDRERITTTLRGGPYWSYGVYVRNGDNGFKKASEQCTPIDVRTFTGYEEATPMPPVGKPWIVSTGQAAFAVDIGRHALPGASLLLQPVRFGSPKFGLSLAVQLGFSVDSVQHRNVKPTLSLGAMAGYSLLVRRQATVEVSLGLLGGLGAFTTACTADGCAGSGASVTMFGPQISPLVGLAATGQVNQIRVGVGLYAMNQIWFTNPNAAYSVEFAEPTGRVVTHQVHFVTPAQMEWHVLPAFVVQW